jgi:hypothetical protein
MILSTAALSEVMPTTPSPAISCSNRRGRILFQGEGILMKEQRYRWRKPSDLPDRVELFDTATNHRVGLITAAGRTWTWNRSTSVLLNGAPPADGTARSLTQAKVRVLDGLPDN